MKILAGFLVIMVVSVAPAETLYKVVGSDGKVTYTDHPPVDGKSTTTLRFASAPSSPLPASVLKYQAELRKSMQNRLAEAKRIDPGTTLYSATWCGYCKLAKIYLKAKSIAYREFDIDTAEGGLAYFQAGGKNGVPLIMKGAKRMEGFTDEAYDSFFSAR